MHIQRWHLCHCGVPWLRPLVAASPAAQPRVVHGTIAWAAPRTRSRSSLAPSPRPPETGCGVGSRPQLGGGNLIMCRHLLEPDDPSEAGTRGGRQEAADHHPAREASAAMAGGCG